jgi:hypothetical protein
MNACWRVGIGVMALVATNLLLDIGLAFWGAERLPGEFLVNATLEAVRYSQVMLLALWLGLGEVKWYWRLLLVAPVTIGVGMSYVLGMTLSPTFRSVQGLRIAPGGKVDMSHILVHVTVLLGAVSAVLPLRRMKKWRLSWRELVLPFESNQFRIADLMCWMVVIGCFLCSLRLLKLYWNETARSDWLVQFLSHIAFPMACYSVITTGSMLAAFAIRNRRQAMVALLVATLLIGGAISGVSAYQLANRAAGRRNSRLSWIPGGKLISFPVGMTVSLSNWLVLAGFGCRLMTPTTNRAAADSCGEGKISAIA